LIRSCEDERKSCEKVEGRFLVGRKLQRASGFPRLINWVVVRRSKGESRTENIKDGNSGMGGQEERIDGLVEVRG
jgi:hypothetical protein